MQKCVNKLNSDERNKNIMISVVPEDDITIDNNKILTNDLEKISWILHITQNTL